MSKAPQDGDATAGIETDPAVLAEVERVDTEASAEVMSLLAEHVPLALLADLTNPAGPASPDILDEEGLPDVEWWGGEDAAAGADTAGVGDDDAPTGETTPPPAADGPPPTER